MGRRRLEGPRLARQDRHVVPGLIDDLVAPKTAPMFADALSVLRDHNAIGVGVNINRATDGLGHQLSERSDKDDAALIDDGDPITATFGFFQLVSGEQDGSSLSS